LGHGDGDGENEEEGEREVGDAKHVWVFGVSMNPGMWRRRQMGCSRDLGVFSVEKWRRDKTADFTEAAWWYVMFKK
jgi:hypothetical protein